MQVKKFVETETEMIALAKLLARASSDGTLIFLQGVLGAGKTTFARGYLQGLGFQGKVKSPTYTLVETYFLGDRHINHFDLYRLHGVQELFEIGLEDYLTHEAITLIEWPERAYDCLPVPTISCTIEVPSDAMGRWVHFSASDEKGQQILQRIAEYAVEK